MILKSIIYYNILNNRVLLFFSALSSPRRALRFARMMVRRRRRRWRPTHCATLIYVSDTYIYKYRVRSLIPTRDASNIAKHSLSMVEGEAVLNDPPGLTVEDDSSEGGSRWMNAGGEILLAVWTERDDERLILVPQTTAKEREDYEG